MPLGRLAAHALRWRRRLHGAALGRLIADSRTTRGCLDGRASLCGRLAGRCRAADGGAVTRRLDARTGTNLTLDLSATTRCLHARALGLRDRALGLRDGPLRLRDRALGLCGRARGLRGRSGAALSLDLHCGARRLNPSLDTHRATPSRTARLHGGACGLRRIGPCRALDAYGCGRARTR